MEVKKGAAFIDAFRAAEAQDRTLDIFADDADGFGAALAEDLDGLASAVQCAAGRPFAAPADVLPGAYVSAALRRDGGVVADDGLSAAIGPLEIAAAVAALGARTPAALIVSDKAGRPMAITASTWAEAKGWPLAPQVKAAADSGRAALIVLGFKPDTEAWRRANLALGLTGSEARLVEALGRLGDLRRASRSIGLTYESARTLLASCLRKTGCSRQTELVRLALSLTAGAVRAPEQSTKLFAELFALTPPQAKLAHALAAGGTRASAAKALGMSEHRAKSELKTLFLACGVANAADLARQVAEVEALSGLAYACDVDAGPDDPIRLIKRQWAPGRICFADHGPPDGRPVVVFHTSTGGRTHSPRLMTAAKAAGLRMIAVERPGYGLTDPVDAHPFEAAARDVAEILDALQISEVAILGRGGSTAALFSAAHLQARVLGGVLLGPDPPADLDRMRSGMMGWGKKVLFDNPRWAESFARLLSRRTSSDAIAKMMKQSVQGSAPDEAALKDKVELAALVRGGRQSAIGMWGFLREHLAHGAGCRPPSVDGLNWTIMVGMHDPLYHFEDAEEFWRTTLPNVNIEFVQDGGRFLHMTHTIDVISALSKCSTRS